MKKRVDNKGRKLPDGFSQRPDGRYQARFTYGGKRYCLYDTDLNMLKQKVIQKQVDIQHDGIVVEDYALNDWFEKWVSVYKCGKIKASTLYVYTKTYNLYIKNTIGKCRISKIKQIQIKDLYKNLQSGEDGSTGISSGTLKILHNILRQLFDTARHNDIIVKNPTEGLLKDVRKDIAKGQRALTKEEQELFFKYLNSDLWKIHKPMFTVLFGTGIRIGELGGLTWDDVDLKNNCIHIKRTLLYIKDLETNKMKRCLQTPKTISSIRTLELLPEVRKAFIHQKEMQMALGISGTMEIDGVKGFCFTSSKGTPRIETDVYKIIQNIVLDINKDLPSSKVFEPFTPHCTRHTYATRCFESGMAPKTVQKLLGHTKMAMTLDIYTHVTEEQTSKELELIKNMKIS